MTPAVSCLVATHARPRFLRQLVRCFGRQTLRAAELIVVDDSAAPDEGVAALDPRIRYVWLDRRASLGRKLNLAAALARAPTLQKLDDDDWYHADFLASTHEALTGQGEDAVVAAGTFLVLMAARGTVHHAGRGWFAGATLAFPQALWQRHPFRDVTKGEDWFFLEDAAPRRIRLARPELFMAVRHGAHTWACAGTRDVDALFARRPRYARPLQALVPPGDLAFYDGLRARPAQAGLG